jgi:hypothetical protein
MHAACKTFATYGVNANPKTSGSTGGEKTIVSRRNISQARPIC